MPIELEAVGSEDMRKRSDAHATLASAVNRKGGRQRVDALHTTTTRAVSTSLAKSFRMARAAFGVSGTSRRTAAMSCSRSM